MSYSLSGYRIMWMMVMFDLPTLTEDQRRAANKFRHFLLDEGFEMAQLSVYMRVCGSREKVDSLTKRIGNAVPEAGKISVLSFTDRQYETMVHFDGRTKARAEKPEQFVMF
ncbi:MAG: CRISPR-associated endonuclease Cas2 [Pseudomonadota bacterium]